MDCTDYPVDYNSFEIGYCGHPSFLYTNIEIKQTSDLILSHFQEYDHPLIIDTLRNKTTQFVYLYYIYRPNKNVSRKYITNYDEKFYKYVPTYGDYSTDFHCHMISGVVIFYSNTLQIILVDYAVTDMGCFDDYSDAAPRGKTMGGNGITTFILHVAQCITFHQKIILQKYLFPIHG